LIDPQIKTPVTPAYAGMTGAKQAQALNVDPA
jgi:hypothetical protein